MQTAVLHFPQPHMTTISLLVRQNIVFATGLQNVELVSIKINNSSVFFHQE